VDGMERNLSVCSSSVPCFRCAGEERLRITTASLKRNESEQRTAREETVFFYIYKNVVIRLPSIMSDKMEDYDSINSGRMR
jgi:hypothetical protein